MERFKKLSKEQSAAVKGGYTVISSGTDQGGDYEIRSTENSCEKVYTNTQWYHALLPGN